MWVLWWLKCRSCDFEITKLKLQLCNVKHKIFAGLFLTDVIYNSSIGSTCFIGVQKTDAGNLTCELYERIKENDQWVKNGVVVMKSVAIQVRGRNSNFSFFLLISFCRNFVKNWTVVTILCLNASFSWFYFLLIDTRFYTLYTLSGIRVGDQT